ncbi:gfo/Idh/MocA family oxidoreductase, partial [Staphylococcus aureus]|nr:gfo/Idh/MocA family oxidoreductase [Staphylococcus aureus]
NYLEVDEAKCSLSGTKSVADMKDGLLIHGEDMGTLYTKHVELENKGFDFYEGNEVDEAEEEAIAWIDAVVNDTEPVVKPEQAMV